MEDLSTKSINYQLNILKINVLEVVYNTNQFAIHLARSDSERQKLKDELLVHVEQFHKNYELNPHIPRHSTPFTEEKIPVKGSLTPFPGENAISAKDIPKLEELPTFSVEGKHNHIELIRTIDMLQEYFHIPVEIIVGKFHSFFTGTTKKWYYKMRQDHGKHDWPWWKSEKDRLSALHPDTSDSMIDMKILREFGGELEFVIKCRCVEPFSSEDYINSMKDVITRTRIGKTWTRNPMESKMAPKILIENKRPERPVLKCHKCGSTSHLSNTCTKKSKINEVQVIAEVQCDEEKKNLTKILLSLKTHQ
ncbi:hypothetical protein O181_013801 [Austropuccinia psidii MF-1]|uniref:CCHC-type domain-containing protein n=1 Tax=Austropuccinia psidii MF-1 TaxID=1389203 RepID=A0A9Q3GNK7_9BASI|nr:hypothetical protein [Austropuccinia psidii MF-1]